jgi:hypothetical protein
MKLARSLIWQLPYPPMNTIRILLLLGCAAGMISCAHQPKPASNKKLKLETIDHGPGRPKSYVYREVD